MAPGFEHVAVIGTVRFIEECRPFDPFGHVCHGNPGEFWAGVGAEQIQRGGMNPDVRARNTEVIGGQRNFVLGLLGGVGSGRISVVIDERKRLGSCWRPRQRQLGLTRQVSTKGWHCMPSRKIAANTRSVSRRPARRWGDWGDSATPEPSAREPGSLGSGRIP
ncbi:hypothetical protein GQR58_030617 [Nymphon striatum]|nr:hypothetical protein GQR58_030617 [Nymphon striatum]